jgi:hypothetical protein
MSVLLVLLLGFVPAQLDLPPEGINTPAVVAPPATAERGTQVQVLPTAPPPAPQFADDCAEMRFYRQSAGLPSRFDQLGWRESNCRNEVGVHTSCCWGYWQLNVSLHLQDHRLVGPYHDCGVYSRTDVDGDNPGDKQRQACAAKALFDVVGWSAWST